jgi:hypothetical protein
MTILPFMPTNWHCLRAYFLMLVHPPIIFSLVNMHKRNTVTHTLLNSDMHTNLFLLQEPWFDTISTARNNDARQGIDIGGRVASPSWEILYPVIPKSQRPKVMAYACRQAPNTHLELPFMVVPRHDVSDHPCVQVLDIVFDTTTWQVINIYHNVHNITSLRALTNLDIDMLTPTLVMGNFNTHADTWSPPDIP